MGIERAADGKDGGFQVVPRWLGKGWADVDLHPGPGSAVGTTITGRGRSIDFGGFGQERRRQLDERYLPKLVIWTVLSDRT
jgi:hypothetical protein